MIMKHLKQMKRSSVVRTAALLLLVAIVASCGIAYAAWPDKRVTLIWHSAAGSSGDLMCRALAKFMETKTNITFIVENVTGASGANAWTRVARSKPDGTTILGVSSTFIASTVQNNMSVNYTSFDPIAQLFVDTLCIFAGADAPYKNLEDLFADAKKRPGELTFTGGTAGNLEFVAIRELMKEAGVDMPLVPFEGGSEGVVAIMGGHVVAGIGEYAEIAPAVAGGKVKVLATFNKLEGLDVQLVSDLGYKTTIEKFRGILVPKETPQDIKDAIFNMLKDAMEDPDFKEFYTKNYLVPAFNNSENFYKLMESQTEGVKTSLANVQ